VYYRVKETLLVQRSQHGRREGSSPPAANDRPSDDQLSAVHTTPHVRQLTSHIYQTSSSGR